MRGAASERYYVLRSDRRVLSGGPYDPDRTEDLGLRDALGRGRKTLTQKMDVKSVFVKLGWTRQGPRTSGMLLGFTCSSSYAGSSGEGGAPGSGGDSAPQQECWGST